MSRLLGIDLGEKRIGLALSDESKTLASPLAVYERLNKKTDLEFFQSLVARESITEMVLGLPTNMDGSLGPKAQETLEFKSQLEAFLKITVQLFDERLTTVEAERVLIDAGMSREKRRGVKDKLSAVLILQGYLDSKRKNAG
ncbi:Holliday junction resolvase RuvX [Candidatus Acetothermia bacterium]|nr:Holliday junction resolvase RuvX [Candidatus Acetothermia bacterium]MBI3460161.1 Holliday junction resolvase RuvX [Candidatus Acetothermia bacterium]MBI3661366.1 Holliday junction resolvase RuvX [Candidatus Acetothermia bacterium]